MKAIFMKLGRVSLLILCLHFQHYDVDHDIVQKHVVEECTDIPNFDDTTITPLALDQVDDIFSLQ